MFLKQSHTKTYKFHFLREFDFLFLNFDLIIDKPDDFDGDVRVCLVVEGADDLAEAAATDDLEDLVAVADVVVQHLVVAAVFVVVAAVVRRVLLRVHLARVQPQVPHLRVLADLAAFVLRHALTEQP